MPTTLRTVAACTALALFLGACGGVDAPDRDNPWDEGNPDYVPPMALIEDRPDTSFATGEPDITFRWGGNTPDVTGFSYRLHTSSRDESDTASEVGWSAWSPAASVTFESLDEGAHFFEVRAQYPTGAQSKTPDSREFTVDAVKGPALIVQPRLARPSPGERMVVNVVTEGVEDLMLAHVVLSYDASTPDLLNVEEGDMMPTHADDSGGTPIFLSDVDGGVVDISLGLALADPAGVSGEGSLARLEFRVLRAGDSQIAFGGATELRDTRNRVIPGSTYVPADVRASSRN